MNSNLQLSTTTIPDKGSKIPMFLMPYACAHKELLWATMLVFLCCVYLRSEEFDVNILVNHMIALLARPRMKWPVSEMSIVFQTSKEIQL